MGGSSPTPPTPHDPGQTAQIQTADNIAAGTASQAGSMVNQDNPFGSLTYTQTGVGPGGVPIYSASVGYSPQNQALIDSLMGTKATAGTAAGNILSNAGYGTGTSPNVGQMTSDLTTSLMGKETSYLDPYFTQQSTNLDAQMRNQGLAPGMPAYDNAMENLRQSQGRTVTGFEASVQPQVFNEAVTSANLPLQQATELASLGAPVSPTNSFVNAPGLNIQPANYTGAVAAADQAAATDYAAQMQQQSAMMSGMFGIPSTILGGWARGGFANPLGSLGGSAAGSAAGGTDAMIADTALMAV